MTFTPRTLRCLSSSCVHTLPDICLSLHMTTQSGIKCGSAASSASLSFP